MKKKRRHWIRTPNIVSETVETSQHAYGIFCGRQRQSIM